MRSYQQMMNSALTDLREEMKLGLSECNKKEQLLFKRCFSYADLKKPINEVVDGMEEKQLKQAFDLVSRTLKVKEKENGAVQSKGE